MVSEILGPDLFGPEGMPLVSHSYISYFRPFTTLPRSEMRRLFEIIKKLVERRYQDSEVMAENRDLQLAKCLGFLFPPIYCTCNSTSPPFWSLPWYVE